MVLIVVAIQIGDLEFDFEDGGLEGQKLLPVWSDSRRTLALNPIPRLMLPKLVR
jgi:hypothetical protein